MRPLVSSAFALALLSGAGFAVAAQDNTPSRQIGASQPLPRDGTYIADDRLTFVVDRRGERDPHHAGTRNVAAEIICKDFEARLLRYEADVHIRTGRLRWRLRQIRRNKGGG